MKRGVRILLWAVWVIVFVCWLWWYWFPQADVEIGYVLVTNGAWYPRWRHLPDLAMLVMPIAASAMFLRPDWFYRSHHRTRAPMLWASAGGWLWAVLLAMPWIGAPTHVPARWELLLILAVTACLMGTAVGAVRRREVRGRICGTCSTQAVVVAILVLLAAGVEIPTIASHKTFWGKIAQIYDGLRRIESTLFWPIAIFLCALASRLIIDHLRWVLPPDDQPLCERCGYDLRGSIPAGATHCPECGEAIAGEFLTKL